eukprot:2110705-Amphidinium_carterae.1
MPKTKSQVTKRWHGGLKARIGAKRQKVRKYIHRSSRTCVPNIRSTSSAGPRCSPLEERFKSRFLKNEASAQSLLEDTLAGWASGAMLDSAVKASFNKVE